MIIIIIIIIFFLTLVKTRVGKKLRKVERGLKWKTSIIIIIIIIIIIRS